MDTLSPEKVEALASEISRWPNVAVFFDSFKLSDPEKRNPFILAFLKLFIATQSDAPNAGEDEIAEIYRNYSWIEKAKFLEKPAFAFFNSVVSNVMRHKLTA